MNVHVRLLAILLSFDILLIFTSGLLRVAVIGGYLAETPTFLNIGRDWSAGEMLNYAKWSLMAVVFVLTWRVTGLRLYMALAFFVLLVLADDALQLHERGSEILMTAFPALRADSGSGTEIVIWIMIGLLGLSAVGCRTEPGWRAAFRTRQGPDGGSAFRTDHLLRGRRRRGACHGGGLRPDSSACRGWRGNARDLGLGRIRLRILSTRDGRRNSLAFQEGAPSLTRGLVAFGGRISANRLASPAPLRSYRCHPPPLRRIEGVPRAIRNAADHVQWRSISV
ncbi:hypothetical protein [uncultured Jannaschia sp.]|uniref:hypothetical protein n=1 Tax=uncultured Jannaschia sp. TaxID=293347 RepID=UPI0026246D84|nr:hypothetical protein [uncultured Jannaschia sp.]